MTVLPNLAQENEALKSKLAAMQAALDKANQPKRITMKVGQAGGLSVYGLGRFPVTLYRSQWERLIKAIPDIEAFILANSTLLTTKD